MVTRIGAGLNRVIRLNGRRHIEHKNVELEIEAPWNPQFLFHRAVIDVVTNEYPGWALTGYALRQDRT